MSLAEAQPVAAEGPIPTGDELVARARALAVGRGDGLRIRRRREGDRQQHDQRLADIGQDVPAQQPGPGDAEAPGGGLHVAVSFPAHIPGPLLGRS